MTENGVMIRPVLSLLRSLSRNTYCHNKKTGVNPRKGAVYGRKKKFPFYLSPEKKAILERRYQEDGSQSLTAFIEKAVDFYLDYLSANDAGLFLPTSIKSYLDGRLGQLEERLSSIAFRQTVEQDTMLHEMVHLYCREHNIKEVSRGGKYHNGRFKAEAERRGLTCIPCGQYGWNTTPGDNLIEYALSKGWNEIKIGRSSLPPMIRTGTGGAAQAGTGSIQGGKRPSSTRKLICPKCGQSVRATKAVNILCGDCLQKMVEA